MLVADSGSTCHNLFWIRYRGIRMSVEKVALITAGGSGMGAAAARRLASFTKIFTDKYAAKNIRMNNVLPGWIDSLPATQERRNSVPMGRYGTTQEIADTVAFLLSAGAGYITGQNIRVDGGITRSI